MTVLEQPTTTSLLGPDLTTQCLYNLGIQDLPGEQPHLPPLNPLNQTFCFLGASESITTGSCLNPAASFAECLSPAAVVWTN